jgi:hypothetical protein
VVQDHDAHCFASLRKLFETFKQFKPFLTG